MNCLCEVVLLMINTQGGKYSLATEGQSFIIAHHIVGLLSSTFNIWICLCLANIRLFEFLTEQCVANEWVRSTFGASTSQVQQCISLKVHS